MRHRLAFLLPFLALAACDRLPGLGPDNGSVNLSDLEVQEEPPPPEEPPPTTGDEMPPPVVGSVPGYEPAPGAEPAPGGGELADGPDAGAGASGPGGSRARVRAGSLASYITGADYPPAAARNDVQGRVVFTLDIGPEGRVTRCTITASSGSALLDSTTCRIMRSRARYTPARNGLGRPVPDRDRGAVLWRLEG